MKKLLLISGMILIWTTSVFGAKYMTLGQAVKGFLPQGSKVFKVTRELSKDQRIRLKEDYGWTATEDSYVFYVGRNPEGEPQGYVFVVPEIFNTCFHKYAIGLSSQGEVLDTAIVELSCPRAFPVNRKSFLRQFRHKRHTHALTLGEDIDAVTGATLSSETTSLATRKAVSLHNLFFGGGEAVSFSPEVQASRKKSESLVKKAIESGETLWKDGEPKGDTPPSARE